MVSSPGLFRSFTNSRVQSATERGDPECVARNKITQVVFFGALVDNNRSKYNLICFGAISIRYFVPNVVIYLVARMQRVEYFIDKPHFDSRPCDSRCTVVNSGTEDVILESKYSVSEEGILYLYSCIIPSNVYC